MKRLLLQYFKESAFWLCFFLFLKGLFLLCNYDQTASLTAGEIACVFWHGLSMDLSAAGYLMCFPALMLCLLPWFPVTTGRIIQGYTVVLLCVLTLMGFGDMLTYGDWGVRLNVGMLAYLKDWRGVLMNFAWWQWLLLCALLALTVGCWSLLHSRWWRYPVRSKADGVWKRIGQTAAGLLLTGLLILPIRGGLNTSPMSFSNVWFSPKLYANHAACNCFWGFMSSVVHYKADELPVRYMTDDEAASRTESDGTEQGSVPVFAQQPNVLLVLLESFSQYLVEEGVCPRLQQLETEGINWTGCYASGSRSDKGMAAVAAGYPALIQFGSILNYEDKLPSLTTLPGLFTDNGYRCAFLYGGDVNFYNNRIFMLQSGVTDITERSDFPFHVAAMQKWGAPDEYLYDKVLDKAKEQAASGQPWFLMCYNISSHPPFDVHSYHRYEGDDTRTKFCNSLSYADSCLGIFTDRLKASGLWDNTLVVITSDHTAYLPLFGYDIRHPESYRIPMLWTGGAVRRPQSVSSVVSQTDLLETLSTAMGFSHPVSAFSRNMFRQGGFATYYRDEVWGYVSDTVSYSVDLSTGARCFYSGSSVDTAALRQGEAYTQYALIDFFAR